MCILSHIWDWLRSEPAWFISQPDGMSNGMPEFYRMSCPCVSHIFPWVSSQHVSYLSLKQIQTAIYQIQDVIGSVVLIQHQVLLQPRQEKKLQVRKKKAIENIKGFAVSILWQQCEAWGYESIFLMPEFTFNNEKWPFIKINNIF